MKGENQMGEYTLKVLEDRCMMLEKGVLQLQEELTKVKEENETLKTKPNKKGK